MSISESMAIYFHGRELKETRWVICPYRSPEAEIHKGNTGRRNAGEKPRDEEVSTQQAEAKGLSWSGTRSRRA